MTFQFKKAERKGSFIRMALIGPSGSGKTYSALAIASGLADKVAAIDTERGSMKLYADEFGFDVLEMDSFEPENFTAAIDAASSAGYGALIIDSLSHAWMGVGGALDQVDKAAKRSQSGNSFAAWREVTPRHNALVDAILHAPMHLIATLRSKTEWVIEKDERGKNVPRKIGTSPVMRDGVEYEFTVVGDMNLDHDLVISKTRIKFLDEKVIRLPGQPLGAEILAWCGEVKAEDMQPSPSDLKALAAWGTERGLSTDDIQAQAQKSFGKTVRELTLAEVGQLKKEIEAAA